MVSKSKKVKSLAYVALFFLILAIATSLVLYLNGNARELPDPLACDSNEDCGCGAYNFVTSNCIVGNSEYLVESGECERFCRDVENNIACVEGACAKTN